VVKDTGTAGEVNDRARKVTTTTAAKDMVVEATEAKDITVAKVVMAIITAATGSRAPSTILPG
jgi:formyltetrahydrofolate synthetase